MNNIIVFYPREFKSYSKFQRKVAAITQNIGNFNLLYFSLDGDINLFCQKFCEESPSCQSCNKIQNWEDETITHAIIFDDGEAFDIEKNFYKLNNIPIRIIKVKITRVVNINREIKYQGIKSNAEFEYIGRGSYWGNPHSMFDNNSDDLRDDREEVIRKYKYDFDYDKFPNKKNYKQKVLELAGKRLGCFCKPYDCHGDVIADYLNSIDDGE